MMPTEGWDMITHIICFAVNTAPPDNVKKKLRGTPTLPILQAIFKTIRNATKHSYARLDINTSQWALFGPGGREFKAEDMEQNNVVVEKLGMMAPLLPMLINPLVENFLKTTIESTQSKANQVWATISLDSTIVVNAYKDDQILFTERIASNQAATKLIKLDFSNAEKEEAMPSMVKNALKMLPAMGINIEDVLTEENIKPLIEGQLFKYSFVYVRMQGNKVTYAVKNNSGRLSQISIQELLTSKM
jgi:hypothetical protein